MLPFNIENTAHIPLILSGIIYTQSLCFSLRVMIRLLILKSIRLSLSNRDFHLTFPLDKLNNLNYAIYSNCNIQYRILYITNIFFQDGLNVYFLR